MQSANYYCKDGTGPWPRCVPKNTSAYRLQSFPVTAWWGPWGYGDDYNTSQATIATRAYAAANFNVIELRRVDPPAKCRHGYRAAHTTSTDRPNQCSDRTPTRPTFAESWAFVVQGINVSAELGLRVVMDTYGPLARTYAGVNGGIFQRAAGVWINTSEYGGGPSGWKKITPPELQWLAPTLRQWPHVVGILISDDTVDLAKQEIDMIAWMRANASDLMPIVNQAQARDVAWPPRRCVAAGQRRASESTLLRTEPSLSSSSSPYLSAPP